MRFITRTMDVRSRSRATTDGRPPTRRRVERRRYIRTRTRIKHTMFTVRASAQKTTVAVDARAAKKADAKRYVRARDIRIATRSKGGSIERPRDATRAREARLATSMDAHDLLLFCVCVRVASVGETGRRRDAIESVATPRRDRSRSFAGLEGMNAMTRPRVKRGRRARVVASERARLTK